MASTTSRYAGGGHGARRAGDGGVRRFARRAGYAALLLPASAVTVGAVLGGRADRAGKWWARAVGQDPAAGGPGAARLLAHALVCVPLGLLALIPVGIEILFVLRGVFYPLVDRGPYDTSWGGPSAGGAWLAHFGIALPFAAAALVVLRLLGDLHAHLAGRLWGRPVRAWAVAVTAGTSAAGALLVNAWLHQL
ncbi:hypothetical protein [Streptomyces sp. RFCAC02]|uniref:hypothetical protein n=1 Tax=Streptomyces sp. RFCAC02 TaxID=2499143 RepID=UPI00143CCCD8|nr:hypothetical protein [Streptomyces sp. RFCAC02]